MPPRPVGLLIFIGHIVSLIVHRFMVSALIARTILDSFNAETLDSV